MGKLKTEISQLIKKSRGLNQARIDTNKWFNTSNSVVNTQELFKPGKIYVFRYEHPINKERLWDMNPTVLSLGRTEGLDIGLNLNFLTYNQRVALLDRVYEQYYEHIKRSVERSGGNPLRQEQIISMNYDNIKRFLSKTNYHKACRRYINNKRKNTKVISYSDWVRMAIINKSDFNNGDINQAHSKIT